MLEYTDFMESLVEEYPSAKKIILVQDNLNTHKPGSFYTHRCTEIASKLADKFEFHYTPKCSSWLNMIEIEFSALSRQCLNRRIPSKAELSRQIDAIVKERNEQKIKITWQFSVTQARKTLNSKFVKT